MDSLIPHHSQGPSCHLNLHPSPSETFAPLAIEIHHMEFLSVQRFGAKSADPVSAPQSQSSPSQSPWGRSISLSSTTQAAEGCDFDSPAGLSEKAKGKRKASGLYAVDDSSSYVQVAASFSSLHTPDHQLAQSSASQFSANTRAGPSPDPVTPTPIRSSKRQRHHSRTLRGTTEDIFAEGEGEGELNDDVGR